MEFTDKLENHIDEPIKKCVVGMALLGFTPIFSCCGFNYQGEKVSKTHLLDKPYIYLDIRKMGSTHKSLLIDIAHESFWKIARAGQCFIDFHGWEWEGNHPWNAKGCPHRPENAVLGLNALEKVLEKRKDSFLKEVDIVDGNFLYKIEFGFKHWQYEPSEPWTVNPDTFFSL